MARCSVPQRFTTPTRRWRKAPSEKLWCISLNNSLGLSSRGNYAKYRMRKHPALMWQRLAVTLQSLRKLKIVIKSAGGWKAIFQPHPGEAILFRYG
jgi:hypothetical protein